MTANDRPRLELHHRLSVWLGPEPADTLMSHLPSVTWTDVATKADIDAAVMVLGAESRTEMAELRTELRTEMAELRTEMRGEIADLRVAFVEAIEAQTRRMVTFGFALAGLTLTAVRLLW